MNNFEALYRWHSSNIHLLKKWEVYDKNMKIFALQRHPNWPRGSWPIWTTWGSWPGYYQGEPQGPAVFLYLSTSSLLPRLLLNIYHFCLPLSAPLPLLSPKPPSLLSGVHRSLLTGLPLLPSPYHSIPSVARVIFEHKPNLINPWKSLCFAIVLRAKCKLLTKANKPERIWLLSLSSLIPFDHASHLHTN